MRFRLWRPAGIFAGLALLFSAAPAFAQQVASQAVLDRVTIVEGQTRRFQISNVASRPRYHVHASVSGAFTAEAGDVTITTDNLLGQAQAITPDADAPRAHRNATYGTIDFEVTANADSDGAGEETFGVRLCTTADCADGTVLGEWTVTVAEPAADTTLSGTGATLTVPGGAAVSVMEESRNRDGRDRRATFRIDIATAPTSDIAVVAYTETGVSTGARTAPFARINSALSPDYPPHGETGHNDVRAEYLVGYWASGATGAQEFTVISTDNAVDTPGGTIAGDLKFKVFVDDEAFRTTLGGSSSDTAHGNATAYSAIAIPDLPVRVTGDDEPTRIRLLPTSPADNAATEGNTDKATVLVRLDRALVAGEEATALLTFGGATPGTHFTLAAAGGQSGVTYADSEDGTQGLVTLSGAGVQEGVIEVTALMDGDSDSQTLQIGMPPFDQPWRPNFHRSNLDGGVCAAHGCPHRPQGDPGQRFQSVTLAEAAPGLTVVEHDDPDRRQVTEGGDYSYTIQLNTAPTSDVTVTATIASGGTVRSGGALTFTNGNWNMPQTVTVRPDGNNNDEPRRTMTVTHAFSGDTAYAGLADATHEVGVLDDDPTTITMAGAGVRPGGSGSNISRIMVEGDATRIDRTLTLTLGRALEAGEYVRVPLRLEAVANGNDPSLPDDPPDQGDGDPDLPSDLDPRRTTVDSYRGPRASANVAWPPHHNDFVMTATGTGVGYGHSNRYTPNHIGFRYVEFRGEGAQTATIVLHARAGFDDGEAHDEAFAITFPNDFYVFDEDMDQPFNSSPVDSNLGGGVQAMPANAEAWFGIDDDDTVVAATTTEVVGNWPLKPPGLTVGDSFRLLYVTGGTRNARDDGFASYNDFVRAEINSGQLKQGGVPDLRPYADRFAAVISADSATGAPGGNATLNANLEAAGSDAPIYWVGGTRVADDKADFLDGDWDDEANPRHADGGAATISTNGYWTGSEADGQRSDRCGGFQGNDSNRHLRAGANRVSYGLLNDNTRGPLGQAMDETSCAPASRDELRPLYALSTEAFTVADQAAIVARAEAAEGGPVTFTVTISSAAPAGGVTIPYTLSNGRGVSGDPAPIVATGADYADAASGGIVIAQGATTGVITVNTTDDSTYETDHYFTVTLGTPTGTSAPGLNPEADTAIGTITDDADRPEFGFAAATASVTEGTDARATLTVTRTGATEVASSVYWTTADDTASHPGDYTADAGYLQFAPGDTSGTIAIDIIDDADGENAETFRVRLSQPSEATLGGASEATVTLNDDDGGIMAVAAVVVSPTAVTVTENGTATYGVSLATDPGGTVTVTPTSGNTAFATVTGQTATFDSTNFGTAQQITVTGVGAGTATITHAITAGTADYPTGMSGLPSVDVTVTPPVPVDIALSASDGDANGNAVENASDATGHRTLTLTLGRTLTGAETVTVPLTVHGATVATDYTFGLQPATQNGVTLLTSNPHSAQNPAVRFAAGAGAATLRLTPVDNGERSQPYVVIAYGTGGRAPSASGATLGAVSGGPVGVVLVDDETGDIIVPADWDLAPASGVDPGDEFRLVLYTSETTTAEASDIGHYDALVRGVIARKGHAAVRRHAGFFKVFGSSGAISARNHNGLDPTNNGVVSTWVDGSASGSDAGIPVYWLNGARVANNYFDFCDGTWTNHAPQKVESGVDKASSLVGPWTGTTNTCGRFNANPLGNTNPNVARAGTVANQVMFAAFTDKTTQRPLYGMSPVFKLEAAPELSFGAGGTFSVAEGGTATVTVGSSVAAPAATSVGYTVTGGTATGGADYDTPSGTFALTSGATSHSFTIDTTQDMLVEGDETIAIRLDAGTGYSVGSPDTATVTITDDDSDPPPGAGVTVSTASLALTELGAANAVEKSYTLVLDTDPTADVTVTVANGDATAAEVDTDAVMSGNQNTLTFTAGGDGSGTGAGNGNWAVAQTVTVRALNDADGANESFNLTMSAAVSDTGNPYHGIAIDPVAVTTTDAGHGVIVSESSVSVAENDGTATYTVVLKSAPSGNVAVTATSGATANAEVDTDAGTDGNQNTLTFTSSDWNSPQTVTVTGKGAGSTSITHAVSTTGDTTNYPTTTTIPAVSVSVTEVIIPTLKVEGEGGFAVAEGDALTLTLTLSQPATGAITLTVGATVTWDCMFISCPDGATLASAGDVSVFTTRAVNFALGETTKTVSIMTTEDSTTEGTELFILDVANLSPTREATIDPGTPADFESFSLPHWFVRILDDDTTPTASIAGGSAVTEGDKARFTVSVAQEVAADLQVDLTVSDVSGSDFITAGDEGSQSVTIAKGARSATYEVQTVGDSTAESSGDITVAIAGGTGYTTGAPSSAMVTVNDDDTVTATPEVSLALQTGETSNRNADNQLELVESGGVDGAVFNLSADVALASTLTVCLRVTETGGDLLAASAEGIRTATLTSSGNANGAGIHTLNWTGDGDDERNSVVTATLLAPETAECPAANGSYTVSSAMASDAVLIEDDDATAVELTGADTQMAEGDATDTATLTVALGRRLYAGETIVVPFTLATSTGARLPGQATPDFAVSASGTGAAIARDNTATPSLTFTGHDTDTVRTATVTLTPVAGRDDGDTEHEAVTATLASDSALSGSGIGTTVGGGAARGTSFSASLRLTDDEAPAAGAIFSVEGLRLLENGSAQYTVRLNQEPTAAVTMLFSRTGTHAGAATVSPSSQGFYPGSGSVTSWNRPRTITVTGVDEANMRRNRALAVRHAVTTTDPAYSGYTHDLPVEVGDAPEVEAWEGWERAPGTRPGFDGDDPTLSRPHTVSSTPGLWPRQDMVFGSQQPQDYVIRLSNRPEPGGTVTVNVTRSNNDLQLGLTREGPWSNSLTVTFGDGFAEGAAGPNMAACNNSHDYREGGEAHDGTAATSWECWRKVWLRRVGGSHQCTDITHTASGGGIRARTIETIRAHNPIFAIRNNTCPFLTPREEPRTSASELPPPPQAPTRAVSNVQVAAVDAASAKVSWDAVEHATGYEVEYETTSALVDADNHVQGVAAGLTDTSFTFRHDAAEAMTLTVTVTPAHEDENGDTQVLTGLSATATIAVGPSGTGVGDGDATKDGDGGDTDNVDSQIPNPPPASCVSDEQWSTVSGYYDSNANRSPNYGANWYRVLIAYRQDRTDQALPDWTGSTTEPAAAFTAKEAEEQEKLWSGWTPVREVLQCLEKTYGGGSTSTVTRDTPNGSQSGEVGNTHPGEAMERNRREPQTGPAGFEPEAPPDFAAGACVSPRLRSEAVARAGETWRGPAHVERWLRVGRTFSGGANDATVVTPAEASFHAAAGQPGWLPVADALQCMEQQFLREALSR